MSLQQRPQKKLALAIDPGLVQDNVPAEVVSKLFIGSLHAAFNQNVLIEKGITHILNASRFPASYPGTFTYLSIDIRDKEYSNLLSCIPAANIFIEAGIEAGGVLVHCSGGRSRSAAFISAYLMSTLNQSFEQVFPIICQARPVAAVNTGFVSQLKAYSLTCYDVYAAQQILLRRRVRLLRDRRSANNVSSRSRSSSVSGYDDMAANYSQQVSAATTPRGSVAYSTDGSSTQSRHMSHEDTSKITLSPLSNSCANGVNGGHSHKRSLDDEPAPQQLQPQTSTASDPPQNGTLQSSSSILPPIIGLGPKAFSERMSPSIFKSTTNASAFTQASKGMPKLNLSSVEESKTECRGSTDSPVAYSRRSHTGSTSTSSVSSRGADHTSLSDSKAPNIRLSRPGATTVRVIPPMRGLEKLFGCDWCSCPLFCLGNVIRLDNNGIDYLRLLDQNFSVRGKTPVTGSGGGGDGGEVDNDEATVGTALSSSQSSCNVTEKHSKENFPEQSNGGESKSQDTVFGTSSCTEDPQPDSLQLLTSSSTSTKTFRHSLTTALSKLSPNEIGASRSSSIHAPISVSQDQQPTVVYQSSSFNSNRPSLHTSPNGRLKQLSGIVATAATSTASSTRFDLDMEGTSSHAGSGVDLNHQVATAILNAQQSVHNSSRLTSPAPVITAITSAAINNYNYGNNNGNNNNDDNKTYTNCNTSKFMPPPISTRNKSTKAFDFMDVGPSPTNTSNNSLLQCNNTTSGKQSFIDNSFSTSKYDAGGLGLQPILSSRQNSLSNKSIRSQLEVNLDIGISSTSNVLRNRSSSSSSQTVFDSDGDVVMSMSACNSPAEPGTSSLSGRSSLRCLSPMEVSGSGGLVSPKQQFQREKLAAIDTVGQPEDPSRPAKSHSTVKFSSVSVSVSEGKGPCPSAVGSLSSTCLPPISTANSSSYRQSPSPRLRGESPRITGGFMSNDDSPRIPVPPERGADRIPQQPQSAEKKRWLERFCLLKSITDTTVTKVAREDDDATNKMLGDIGYIHLEYMAWMGEEVFAADLDQGQIFCPQCAKVIGSYFWNPNQRQSQNGALEGPLFRISRTSVQELLFPLDPTPRTTPRTEESDTFVVEK